jgi:hypothetical protein
MAITIEIGGSSAQTVVKKSQKFITSGNWTRPANIAGDTVYVTACAGGGSGGSSGSTDPGYWSYGGWGGGYVERQPINVLSVPSATVTIGAGGISAGNGNVGNAGGDTSFGSLLTVRGGSGGGRVKNATAPSTDIQIAFAGSGIAPYMIYSDGTSNPIVSYMTQSSSVAGNKKGANSNISNGVFAGGGAEGRFGNGGDASSGSALANSGAGGGASHTGSTGSGGSGVLIIEWEEFV